MKKILICLVILFFVAALSFGAGYYYEKNKAKELIHFIIENKMALPEKQDYNKDSEYFKDVEYDKSEVIDYYEYLYYPKENLPSNSLGLNDNGDVVFLDKVVLNHKGLPLNEHNAYSDTELKILFAASGITPREGCNPADTDNNGSLGCYIDIPEE